MIRSVRNRSLSAWCTQATRPNVVGARKSKRNGRREDTGPSEKRIACFLTCWAETLNMKIMGNGDGMQMPPPIYWKLEVGLIKAVCCHCRHGSKTPALPSARMQSYPTRKAGDPRLHFDHAKVGQNRSRHFKLRTSDCQFHHQGHVH